MNRHNTYDVIIIGAGSLGTPAAFYLATAGLKVLVLESVPSVGQGSTKLLSPKGDRFVGRMKFA